MNIRKSLKPINSNQHIEVILTKPRTRSKLDKVIDENDINHITKPTRANNLQKLKFKPNNTKDYVRSRLNSTSSASTESIPECKSLTHLENISNIYSSEENTNCTVASKKTITPSVPNHIHTHNFYPIPNLFKCRTFSDKISVPIWKKTFKPRSILLRRNSSLISKFKENISDEVILRRHEKYVACEKKVDNEQIKKLIDEQPNIAEEPHKTKWNSSIPKTFDPELSDCKIVVIENVPLRAFGNKLPGFDEDLFNMMRLP